MGSEMCIRDSLRTTKLPKLDYHFKKNKLCYRWTNVVPGFDMPVRVIVDGQEVWLHPTTVFKKKKFKRGTSPVVEMDRNFYVK